MSEESALGRQFADDAEPTAPLNELSLPQLRSYRGRLSAEEDRVSYWRRLLHARIDVLKAERTFERPLRLEELVKVLGDTASGRSRRALVAVRAADPLPAIPVLAEIWVTELDPNDLEARTMAGERLRKAERQLTEYRHALHVRIDAATAELIARYREDPSSALTALPHPGSRRSQRQP